MAPVLFLFLMTAFAETLELIWRDRDILILSVMTAADEHLAEGKICSHTPAMFRSKKLTAYGILQCLYVDDGAFPFGTREDLQQGMELVYHHFARFGLEMHIGRGALESKTECVFFPPPPVLPAPRKDQQCGQHDTTRVSEGATHMQYSHCIGKYSPKPIPPPRIEQCTVSNARKLPHWMSHYRCVVPSETRQRNWSGNTTHHKIRHFLS